MYSKELQFLSHQLADVTCDKTLIATFCKSGVAAPYKRHQDAGAIFGAELRASGSAKKISLSLNWIYSCKHLTTSESSSSSAFPINFGGSIGQDSRVNDLGVNTKCECTDVKVHVLYR